MTDTANFILGVLTIGGQIGLVVLLIAYFSGTAKPLTRFIAAHGLFLSFLLATAATIGSFFYSNIVGFTPCELCWYQRICLFPQVAIFALGSWFNDRNGSRYGFVLSVVGALIAAYNSYLQMGGQELFPCAANGASCAQRFVFEFGYITIPLMSLTAFLLLAALQLIHLRETRITTH